MDTDPSHLSRDQRLELAKVSGTVQRVTIGVHRDLPRAEKIAALNEITTDPVVLGFVLGQARASVELEGYVRFGEIVEVLTEAGADEQVADAVLTAARAEFERRGRG